MAVDFHHADGQGPRVGQLFCTLCGGVGLAVIFVVVVVVVVVVAIIVIQVGRACAGTLHPPMD